MKSKLSKEDAAALDLLLDRSPAASGRPASRPVYAAANGASPKRVRGAEKVLSLLQLLPAGDPPQDLVARTLRRVGGATASAHAAVGAGALVAHSSQPHA